MGLVIWEPQPRRHGTSLKSKGGWSSMLSSQISGDCNAAEKGLSRYIVKAKFRSSLVILAVEQVQVGLWSGLGAWIW